MVACFLTHGVVGLCQSWMAPVQSADRDCLQTKSARRRPTRDTCNVSDFVARMQQMALS